MAIVLAHLQTLFICDFEGRSQKAEKMKRGFYLYGAKGRKSRKQVDPSVYGLISTTGQGKLSAVQCAERCVMMMLNEAARCFDEQVIKSARDGDIGAVFGIGFPPFLGGPFLTWIRSARVKWLLSCNVWLRNMVHGLHRV